MVLAESGDWLVQAVVGQGLVEAELVHVLGKVEVQEVEWVLASLPG